jgi:glycosyltransferase involved in cell wall biosynthesis
LNSNNIKISVIIPVFNAGRYVRKAVESALIQPETAEVILVEDGSTDNSLQVCKSLEAEHEKVRLFVHKSNANLGAGPSRNLGIEKSQCEFIVFLDADDYFLPDRFEAERRIFPENPDVDGVYGAAGSHYYSEKGKRTYDEYGYAETITIDKRISSEEVFETLMGRNGVNGYFILGALTLRKRLLSKTGVFGSMRLHQDSELILKMASLGVLEAGEIERPIINIGIHDSNRIVANPRHSKSQEEMYWALYEWAMSEGFDSRISNAFLDHYHLARIKRSGKFAAFRELFKLAFVNKSFYTNKRQIGIALDHILGGTLLRAYSSVRGIVKGR